MKQLVKSNQPRAPIRFFITIIILKISFIPLFMDEKLVRGELPIQSIYQRDEAVTATVPIHLAVMDLSQKVRTDVALIADARDFVKSWYDKDMTYYLGVLKEAGMEFPWLEAYERFRDEWELGGEPSDGFLSLSWREKGKVHGMKFNPVTVVLCNQHNEFGEFYTPESFTKGGRLIEIIYRNVADPEIVAMSPEKLKKYGRETDLIKIDEDRGIAKVVGNAFTSDYHMNMAKTLLLRDFAVFYLNRLFDKANGSSP